VRRWPQLIVGGLLLVWMLAGLAQQPGVQVLDQAELVFEGGGGAVVRGPVALPLHWDVVHVGLSGQARLRLAFDSLPGWQGSEEPFSLFIARLGSAYEIRVNGALLAQAGVMDRRGDAWSAKQPVTVSFPAALLQPRNVLEIALRVDAGRRSGLSVVSVGPARQLEPVVAQAHLLRVAVPQAASVFSLLVAVFCALLWWQHRDPVYAWAGLGEALWAVAVFDTIIESAPLRWPWWGLVVLMSRALWSWSLFAVARQVFGPRPRFEGVMLATVVCSTPLVVGLALALRSGAPLVGYQLAHFAAWGVICTGLLVRTLKEPRSERVLLLVAIAACVLAGMRDMAAARWVGPLYDESAWIKYVATLVGAAVMWIVSMRFRQARREVLQLNASLADRVEQKEHELRDSFARLAEVESGRAVLAERERILRDMHDGVGANLATAVRQLESGQARPGEVAQTLRESMDHLKLSIDAMSLPHGDVNALLASLRYRLQPRIESAGLALDWQVQALPLWPAGSDEAMRHLQFLLLEAISNSLQHASARRLTLQADSSSEQISVTLSDDGRGISTDSGRGLRSMRERAATIGAGLRVEAALPGTRVQVTLGLAAKSGA
jgi:signal transduction histidine kinase